MGESRSAITEYGNASAKVLQHTVSVLSSFILRQSAGVRKSVYIGVSAQSARTAKEALYASTARPSMSVESARGRKSVSTIASGRSAGSVAAHPSASMGD